MNPLATVFGKDAKKRAPELAVSQFKVSRPAAGNKKKATCAAVPDALLTTDPRAYHNNRISEFARDIKETLPKKRKELERSDLDVKQRQLLTAQVRALESGQDRNTYIQRVTPLLEKYEQCLRTSLLNTGCRSSVAQAGIQHFGRVENKELKAAKDAFFIETLGYVPVAEGSTSPAVDSISLACEDCKTPLVVDDGYDVCIECGAIPVNSCSDYQISYRDTQELIVKANGSYKRTARFSDWLSSIQAKENTEIPANVYEAILKEIARERIDDLSLVDTAKIKEYLGKMRLTRYYDHAPRIVKYISGMPPVTIPPDVEAKLNIMFNHIQEAFEIVKARSELGRSSFMHYPFVLFKFCQLLERTDIIKPQLLKCPEKLRVQEMLWQGVCEIVGWPFIPSI